jgi:hypothetical protein
MNRIDEIFKLKLSPKEQKNKLITEVLNGKIDIDDLMNYFVKINYQTKNICADVLVAVSSKQPELFEDYINILFNYIAYDSPKVRWGVQETIGNLAMVYPTKVEPAVPLILKNTKKSKMNTTLVRCSAAYALTEILKDDENIQQELLQEIHEIIASEENEDIVNVYLNGLKLINDY